MRGFTAGGTTEYRSDTTRSRDGEEMGGGLQVGNRGSADHQGDHGQVREAGGKGFELAPLIGHPQHSPEDLHIGHHNENKTTEEYTKAKTNNRMFPVVVWV